MYGASSNEWLYKIIKSNILGFKGVTGTRSRVVCNATDDLMYTVFNVDTYSCWYRRYVEFPAWGGAPRVTCSKMP